MTVKKLLDVFVLLTFKILQCITDTILAIIYRGPSNPTVPIKEDCLLESATALAARIRAKKITSEEVVEATIRRISEINDTINAVVENRFDEALAEAREVDKMLAKGSKTAEEIEKETPFLGVPFSIKDGVGVKGVNQASGVVARKNIKATQDAEAVALLRAAGGIPLVTTNVPELASWWETNNRLFGRTKNPYHTQRFPGGSSGGEGALLASAGSFMGIGTDVGGSVRIPANFCGIFAHKPTVGVVPDTGRIPYPDQTDSINVVGPMSKAAVDLKPMMRVFDQSKKLQLDTKVNLKQLKYFYMDDHPEGSFLSYTSGTDPRIKKAVHDVVNYLSETHGVKVEKALLPQMNEADSMWWVKMNDKADAALMSGKQSLKDILWEVVKIALGLSEHTIESPAIWFRQLLTPKFGSHEHTRLLAKGEQFTKDFQKLLGKDGILLFPSWATPALRHGASIFHMGDVTYTSVFNLLKVPVTQCPIAQTEDGLPIGIQVVAAQFNDHLTLAVAEELEKAFEGWKPPLSQPKWS